MPGAAENKDLKYPSYLNLSDDGFQDRIHAARELYRSCTVCPRKCKINRLLDEKGFCETGRFSYVNSRSLHPGEEPPVRGHRGSGTIFFTHCNLRCVFCQNYSLSHMGVGSIADPERIARMMMELKEQGAHNINYVTPSHVVPDIIEAIYIARNEGLNIPILYNSGGYDAVETIKLLDGIVDIYMPDMKYSDDANAKRYSAAGDYWDRNRDAIKQMHRQVGTLKLDSNGVAIRGLLVRHLVLPNNLAGSETVLEFIANEIDPNTYVSIMSQYFPAHKAFEFPDLKRRIYMAEYDKVLEIFNKLGLENGYMQG